MHIFISVIHTYIYMYIYIYIWGGAYQNVHLGIYK